jgi:hypothetical protein
MPGVRLGRPIFLAVELPAGGFGELVELLSI